MNFVSYFFLRSFIAAVCDVCILTYETRDDITYNIRIESTSMAIYI